MSQVHTLSYIRELINQGFTLEFIAKDAGVEIKSLERRLARAKERAEG